MLHAERMKGESAPTGFLAPHPRVFAFLEGGVRLEYHCAPIRHVLMFSTAAETSSSCVGSRPKGHSGDWPSTEPNLEPKAPAAALHVWQGPPGKDLV